MAVQLMRMTTPTVATEARPEAAYRPCSADLDPAGGTGLTILLRRVASRPDGVAGVLLVASPHGALPLCLTLEDPWKLNRVGESCIPAATYRCRRGLSPRFGTTYTVLGVPGRSFILFHWGNTQADTRGCILLGTTFGILDSKMDIGQSKSAFNAFMGAITVPEFTLRIEDCWGGDTRLYN